MATTPRPVHEIKIGSVRAAIWENSSRQGRWFRVSVTRIYRDGDEWREAHSFGRDELPIVSKIADMAYSWIWDAGARSTERKSTLGRGDE